jgi:copper resistance protein C
VSARLRRAAVAAALVLAFLVGPLMVESARAHAIVLESVPAADAVVAHSPERVVLRFNSKIEKRLTRVTLGAGRAAPRPLAFARDDAGAQDPDRLVIPLAPLPPGPYVIRYKVLSADGHVTEGALRFTVKQSG